MNDGLRGFRPPLSGDTNKVIEIDQNSKHTIDGLGLADRVRYRLGRWSIRLSSLWPEVKRFSHWIEREVLPRARDVGADRLRLEIRGDGEIQPLGYTLRDAVDPIRDHRALCRFLHRLGVRRVDLDLRIDGDQIEEVLTLVYALRRHIRRRTRSRGTRSARSLFGHEGVQFACAQTRILDDELSVTYYYCVTCFSRVVRWFENRHGRFADHRALFQAAPRFGLIAGLVAIGPFLIYAFLGDWHLLLMVTVLAAALLFMLVYLFFMIVGSVEYDNEEKAHRLGQAYQRLKHYTDRIREDAKRARHVQQRLLPDRNNMPLGEYLAWGSSFVPEAEVGGDYFDASAVDDHTVAVLFADVSGHGMAAALITTILKTRFQAWLDDHGSLEDLVRQLNSALCRLIPEDSYAAVFAAVYDAQTRRLRYLNCGHHPEPWRVGADPAKPIKSLSEARNLLLGVEPDLELVHAEEQLEPGDTIRFVSDGLIEARNVEGKRFETPRMERLLQTHRNGDPQALVDRIVDEVRSFAAENEPQDDQTALAFRVR